MANIQEVLLMRNMATVSGDSARAEQRDEHRTKTVLQMAKLTTRFSEELCILRDVSPGGLRADVYREIAEGEAVMFELRTGRQVTGHVVWSRGGSIGVAFDTKIPILAYLAHNTIQEMGYRVRAPRINIEELASLRVAERQFNVDIIDASQAGVRIRTDRVLFPGGSCQITLEGIGEKGGIIRWFRQGEAGLVLKQPLSFAEFAIWRRQSYS